MFEFYMLLERSLRSIATVTKLSVAVIFSLYFFGSPPGPFAVFPFGVVFALLLFLLYFFLTFGLVECNKLSLEHGDKYLEMSNFGACYILNLHLFAYFRPQFE